MPRQMFHPFRGVTIDSARLNHEIVEAVIELGDSKIASVADWLGPPWPMRECQKLLAGRLRDLTEPGRPLERRRRGVYGLRNTKRVLAVDRAHRHDQRAIAALWAMGGIAEFMEWFREAYPGRYRAAHDGGHIEGLPPSAIIRRSSEWRCLHQAARRLVKSGEVCRDFSNNAEGDFESKWGMKFPGSDGIYNLPLTDLEKCVCRGKWALHVLRFENPHIADMADEDQDDLRDLRFIKVAAAFRRRREAAGITIKDVIGDADVAAAMGDWDLNDERCGKGSLERLYWRFEQFAGGNGDCFDITIGGHLTAPAAFYRAVAAKLAVDAPALSRGCVALAR